MNRTRISRKKSSQQRQHWTCVTNPVNSRRRPLTGSQRAAPAVELNPLPQRREQARKRSRANLKHGTAVPEVATLPPRQEKTRDLAAKLAGVSPRTLQDALTVKDADPELF